MFSDQGTKILAVDLYNFFKYDKVKLMNGFGSAGIIEVIKHARNVTESVKNFFRKKLILYWDIFFLG